MTAVTSTTFLDREEPSETCITNVEIGGREHDPRSSSDAGGGPLLTPRWSINRL